MMRVFTAISFPGLAVLGACYSQHALEAPVPQPATRIVATVTDSGTVAMSNLIGPGSVAVEGIVVSADQDSLRLSMIRVDQRDGRSNLWSHELVTFPRYALTGITERRLDKGRSWLAAGIITGSAVAMAATFKLIGSDLGTGSTVQPPQ